MQVLLFALTLGLVLLAVSRLPVLGSKQKVPELLLLQDITRMKESIKRATGLQQRRQAFISLLPTGWAGNPQLFDAACFLARKVLWWG